MSCEKTKTFSRFDMVSVNFGDLGIFSKANDLSLKDETWRKVQIINKKMYGIFLLISYNRSSGCSEYREDKI